MQRATAVVVALSTVLTAFLFPASGCTRSPSPAATRLVGELLRARERGGVDARLELALDEPRVADVDDERDDDEHDRHQDAGHEQDLAALVRREPARKCRPRSRGVAPRIVVLSEIR